ncbi:uncharacterized protein DUF1918 [Asanoa ferruginea]|jgi:hypothetical protein|uniref:Uncharacterized protein DUF1918 n=1 Tax=Asanoa ferruginea TaxID=53367 RepID=A0A3D9ZCB1_9ACTN|nr:DUF1918 domain-containing protein [Asanoa ferruginea]REF94925.1 uncharacterized protein DUF1918 [Asanoa ferruginea]GIF45495.1 hypothetical protein Afe04nite_00340 [Asanoa ferruginea]HEV7713830.1 DUF1918 domain-containing protein [Asanoa sp.]
MQAVVGDRLVVEGIHVGDPRRDGEILEVRHADGSPPYLVRWPDGSENLVFPGSEAHVERPAK